MNQTTITGIVLRRTNYQEADRILTVLSKELGKVSVIAKGVRRQKSKLAGGIELFAINELSIIPGKSDLHTVTSARMKQSFSELVKDIDKTMAAYEFISLSNKLVDAQTDDEADYFQVLAEGLDGLNAGLRVSLARMWFLLHFMQQFGVAPELRLDVADKPLEPDTSYHYDFDNMRFAQNKNGIFNEQHIKLLRLASRVSRAQKLSNLYVDETIASACSDLCHGMLEHSLL